MGNYVIRFGELASDLGDALKRPPQSESVSERMDCDSYIPLAINLSIFFTFAGMIFFFLAFCCSSPDSDFETQETWPFHGGQYAHLRGIQGVLRLICVFGLALSGGAGLACRNTLQSALLCGL
jgi:hypothetical protein